MSPDDSHTFAEMRDQHANSGTFAIRTPATAYVPVGRLV